MCSALLHASNTSSRGAGKVREITKSSGLMPVLTSFVRATLASIASQLLEIIAQSVEPLLPLGAPGVDPFLRQAERPGLDPAGPDPPGFFRDHQTRAFQDRQVLHHRGQRHWQRPRQLAD